MLDLEKITSEVVALVGAFGTYKAGTWIKDFFVTWREQRRQDADKRIVVEGAEVKIAADKAALEQSQYMVFKGEMLSLLETVKAEHQSQRAADATECERRITAVELRIKNCEDDRAVIRRELEGVKAENSSLRAAVITLQRSAISSLTPPAPTGG